MCVCAFGGEQSPETFPLKLQKWASDYDKRTVPAPLVLRAPRALVLASQSYVDTPTPELSVDASVALVVYLDTGLGDDISSSTSKTPNETGQKEDEVTRAARVTAALDSEKARMKRGWFSEGARTAVQVRSKESMRFCYTIVVALLDRMRVLVSGFLCFLVYFLALNLPNIYSYRCGGSRRRNS